MPTLDKVLVVVTEDWFALSHFKPLFLELATLANEVGVATAFSGRERELEALGLRVHRLDLRRGSRNPLSLLKARNDLAGLIDEQRPTVVHAIAMQSMVTASLALRCAAHRPAGLVHHLTGTGYAAVSRSTLALMVRAIATTAIRSSVHQFNTHLLAENPDDLDLMLRLGLARPGRVTMLPGAGVDPVEFPPLPHCDRAIPTMAFVGRMLRSKGVETLVEAHRMLWSAGTRIELRLYGTADAGAHQAIPTDTLEEWGRRPGATWLGRVQDVVGVWRQADMAVVPSLGGEGLPRAMLEAAACARPLVVSDVPGCRHFVRNGVEGLVVPPGDASSLASALERLASDAGMRRRLGDAARERLIGGYTDTIVRLELRKAYGALSQSLLPDRRSAP